MAKFSRAIDRIPLSEADRVIKTYKRVECCVHKWEPSPVQPTVCHCKKCGACDFGDNDIPREVRFVLA